MLAHDLTILIDAAKRSGDIAKGYFQADPQVWDKGDGAGPVTEADLAVNQMLQDTLPAQRPDYGWLSEESEDTTARLDTQRQFVVDPIDGTRAFIEGSKDWAHSYAIVENGQPVAAVIYLPMRDLLFTATHQGGAYLNGTAIDVLPNRTLPEATLLSAKPNYAPEHWKSNAPPVAKRAFRSSLAFRLGLVAQGRFDAMLTLRPTWEWDVAAGALIVTEAGGVATDRRGGALRFNNAHPQVDGIVAGGGVHGELVSALEVS